MLADKMKASDFLDDVTPHQVANLVWMTLHGHGLAAGQHATIKVRLRDVARSNQALLERALATQGRVIALIARAGDVSLVSTVTEPAC